MAPGNKIFIQVDFDDANAEKQIAGLNKSIGSVARTAQQATRQIVGIGNIRLQGLQDLTRMASALAAVAATQRILKLASGIDILQQSLRSLAKDPAQATGWFERLEEVARAPGIGLEESIRAFARFRASIDDDKFILDLLKNLANANAAAGGTAETFGLVSYQLSQMSVVLAN